MVEKKVDFSILQKLSFGEWQIVDFIITVELREFFQWVKEYVSIAYKQEFISIDGKTKLHIQGAKYDEKGIVAVGGFVITKEKTLEIPDLIIFVFTMNVSERKFSISAAGHPILFDYFISLLEAITQKWPEATQSIEEYIVRLDRLANGLKDNSDSSQDSKGLGGINPQAVSPDRAQRKTAAATDVIDQAKEPPNPPQYNFVLGDEIVNIRYEIEQGSFKRTKGLEYLRYLLFAPNQDINAKQLVIGFQITGNSIQNDDLDDLHVFIDKQDIMDDQAVNESKKRLAELLDEIEVFGASEERVIEKQQLLDYLNSALGMGVRSRAFTDQDENARISVRAAIKRCENKIKKQMPNFADHLGKSIQTGNICRYLPNMPIVWRDS